MSLKWLRRPGPRVGLIYAVVLLLVGSVGFVAIIQLNQINTTVNILTDQLAVERALCQNIISQVFLTRFYAHHYARRQNQTTLDQFNEAFEHLEELLLLAEQQIEDPHRLDMLDTIKHTAKTYQQTFSYVVQLVKSNQRTYAEVLDIQNLAIENALIALRVHIASLENDTVFLAFDNVQNAYRRMNIDTNKYLAGGGERYAVQFTTSYQEVLDALDSLSYELQDPVHLQKVANARTAALTYAEGFEDIHRDYVALHSSLDIMMEVLEPEISHTAMEIAADVEQDFKQKNAYSHSLVAQTRVVLSLTTTIAIIASLGLGIVFSRYLAERSRAEAELRESERRYRTLFEGSPVGLYRSTPTGSILDVNPAFVDILKYPDRDTLLAINAVTLYINAEDRQYWKELMVKQGIVRNFEVQMRRYDGAIILVNNNARLVQSKQGEVLYYEGNIEDITEQREAERELARHRDHLESLVEARTAELVAANKAAQQANRAKSIFLANMSHELRTPLNAVLGFSELMAQDPSLTTAQRDNLETIMRSGEHLLALINDVLELSKIEAGRSELQIETFDLQHMLLGLEEMFLLKAQQKGIALNVVYKPDIPVYVRTDQGKLRQVLINLLNNAVKFTDVGQVTLQVTACYAEKSHMNIQNLRFEVIDTGVGIPPDEIQKVFKAFVQTASGQQSNQGTGLGLPISREYVHLLGGDLRMKSEVGVGTTFWFEMPFEVLEHFGGASGRDTIPSKQVVGIAPGSQTWGDAAIRLLVVEDDAANRDLLIKLLQPLGFDVKTAPNGQAGIACWEQWHPHLIFMDMRMPVMDGYTATNYIKEQTARREQAQQAQKVPNAVIVALTASAFEQDRKKILAAGCDDFIRKPFREADIFAVLEKHLDVQFVYHASERTQGHPTLAKTGQAPDVDTLEAQIAQLDSDWVTEMQQVTLEGDLELMVQLVQELKTRQPMLAQRFSKLLYNFEHDEILSLLSHPNKGR